MMSKTEREEPLNAVIAQLRAAYAALAGALDGLPRGVLVTLYDDGYVCGNCGEPWDGTWSDDQLHLCRDCIDEIVGVREGDDDD